jgi:hypothetical protein
VIDMTAAGSGSCQQCISNTECTTAQPLSCCCAVSSGLADAAGHAMHELPSINLQLVQLVRLTVGVLLAATLGEPATCYPSTSSASGTFWCTAG